MNTRTQDFKALRTDGRYAVCINNVIVYCGNIELKNWYCDSLNKEVTSVICWNNDSCDYIVTATYLDMVEWIKHSVRGGGALQPIAFF